MTWIPIILLVVGGAAVAGVTWSLYTLWQERYSERSQRFEKRLESLGEFAKRDAPMTLQERVLSQWPWLDSRLRGWSRAQALDHELARAGLSYTVSDLLLAMLCSGGLMLILMRWLGAGFLWSLAAVLLGSAFPLLVVRMVTARRQARLEEQLPDVLDFIARAMQAGHAFNSALQMAAGEAQEPIASEFRRTFNEVNVGMPIQQAMNSLAERIDCADMRYFAVSVVINREVGGDLSGLLKGVSTLIRERLKLRLTIKALTSEARASAWVLGLLPFLLGGALTLLNPDYMNPLLSDPAGRKMLVYGLLLMAFGVLWMKQLSKVRA